MNKVQLYPAVELSGSDRVIADPNNYGSIDRKLPAECADGRVRSNRPRSLLVMRGPAGGQALLFPLAVLQTEKDLRAIEAGTKHATTTYDVVRSPQLRKRVPQPASMHSGNCRRSVHGLEVDGRISNPAHHVRVELPELADVYAPRLGVLATDVEDGFERVSHVSGYQVTRLENFGTPSQKRLLREIDRAYPDVDNISVVEGEPTAHHYVIDHHREVSIRADAGPAMYVDTPGAMIDEILRTWELPADEAVIAACAVLHNSLATRDTITAAHPDGGMINYEVHERSDNGLLVVRHDLVVPDGFNL